ncbi:MULTISPECIES: hypothetical protein [unclassified Pseudomonas]|jgi:hypothetical protein|uniref:hypothetical protein n=1 Tax=unclassified Pseudomonas TaxID=196821 RepID=UPI001CBE5771|nr:MULTISPECIES: hypothetical protein [unclassified Pseudomonas]
MSTVEFRVEDGRLFIAGQLVDLPCAVGEVVECGDFLAVRVEPAIGVIFNRNVFAIARSGKVLWQIAESPHGTETDKPYVVIFRVKDEGLVAANWNGVDYLVNLECGSISTKTFNK